jgi:hypothetical protein
MSRSQRMRCLYARARLELTCKRSMLSIAFGTRHHTGTVDNVFKSCNHMAHDLSLMHVMRWLSLVSMLILLAPYSGH